MSKLNRYIVETETKDNGEVKVVMKPIKKGCRGFNFVELMPYLVILILGIVALCKLKGCFPNERQVVTTTNESYSIEFNCIHSEK